VFDVLADHGPQLILCRHEQNAAFIGGHVRPVDRHAGCLAGDRRVRGVTNLVTGLSTATYDGYPLMALGGNVRPGQRHIKTHQSLDNVGVTKPVTKHSVEIMTATAFRKPWSTLSRRAPSRPGRDVYQPAAGRGSWAAVEAVPLSPAPPAVHGVAGAAAIQDGRAAHQQRPATRALCRHVCQPGLT